MNEKTNDTVHKTEVNAFLSFSYYNNAKTTATVVKIALFQMTLVRIKFAIELYNTCLGYSLYQHY